MLSNHLWRALDSYTSAIIVCISLSLVACIDSKNEVLPEVELEETGVELRSVSSEQEMLDIVKNGLRGEVVELSTIEADTRIEAVGAILSNEVGYSTTYRLEQNVGEHDVVKYDGEHLYIAKQKQYYCCSIVIEPMLDGAAAETSDSHEIDDEAHSDTGSAIRILATNPRSATSNAVNQIELPLEEELLGFFLNNDMLTAVVSDVVYSPYGNVWEDVTAWTETSGIMVYDVSDVTEPQLKWDIEIEGGVAEIRRIDNTLLIISRRNVLPQGYQIYVPSDSEKRSNSNQLEEMTAEDLVSKLTINGTEYDLFSAEECLTNLSENSTNTRFSAITSVTTLELNNPEEFESVCYLGSSDGAYVSDSSLYLIEVLYGSGNMQTLLHKFALSGTVIDYRGSAVVKGALWSGGQNDFRINEHQGQLRVVTTYYPDDDPDDRVDFQLTILEESPGSKKLAEVSHLPNDARPDEIGKPDESLYGVRFQQDRAYLVTFENTDPLYVIDLSKPTDPYIAGALEVTGFSDFLHPITDQLLLGLGREDDALKLELFNVADISAPHSLGIILLQDTYSDAQYDRHAFTWLASDVGEDRFAIPTSYYGLGDIGSTLYQFEIAHKQDPNIARMSQVGAIASDKEWGYQDRAVIHNDAIYYIHNSQVWSGFWGEAGNEKGPQ